MLYAAVPHHDLEVSEQPPHDLPWLQYEVECTAQQCRHWEMHHVPEEQERSQQHPDEQLHEVVSDPPTTIWNNQHRYTQCITSSLDNTLNNMLSILKVEIVMIPIFAVQVHVQL